MPKHYGSYFRKYYSIIFFFCWKWQIILIQESKSDSCVLQRSACIVDSRVRFTRNINLFRLTLQLLSPSIAHLACLFNIGGFTPGFTDKEELVGMWRLGKTWLPGHGMVEFGVLRRGNQVNRRFTTLDFRGTDFGLFRELLGRTPWDTVLEKRGRSEESVDFQGSPPPSSRLVHPFEHEVMQSWQGPL